ncbi:hypothetical protein ABKN59_002025 [Abortiporus biennis]
MRGFEAFVWNRLKFLKLPGLLSGAHPSEASRPLLPYYTVAYLTSTLCSFLPKIKILSSSVNTNLLACMCIVLFDSLERQIPRDTKAEGVSRRSLAISCPGAALGIL